MNTVGSEEYGQWLQCYKRHDGVVDVLEFVENQHYVDEPQDDDEHNDVSILSEELDVMGLQVGDMWEMTGLLDVAEEIMKGMGLEVCVHSKTNEL